MITVDDVLRWEPCDGYDETRLQKLMRGRESLTPTEVLALRIPYEDRLWVVLHEGVLLDVLLHEFACRCTERALRRERKAGYEPDPRSWAAIRAKRAWLRGEITDVQLAAAKAAAGVAAGDAAWAAAWVAAGGTAEVAECKWQCATLRRMISEAG